MLARLCHILTVFTVCYVISICADNHYTNEWAAEIKGGLDTAKRVAMDHGYEVLHEVGIVLHGVGIKCTVSMSGIHIYI
jgi:hypothetical protein